MTDLSPDLIERGAKALWDEPGWDRASHEQRQHHREAAERALSAVAPLIAAQALEEAAQRLASNGPSELTFTGAVAAELRASAAKLREVRR